MTTKQEFLVAKENCIGDRISHNLEPYYARLHWCQPSVRLLTMISKINDLVCSFVYFVLDIRFITARIMSTCDKLTVWTWQSENHWGLQRMASSGPEKVGYDNVVVNSKNINQRPPPPTQNPRHLIFFQKIRNLQCQMPSAIKYPTLHARSLMQLISLTTSPLKRTCKIYVK